MSKKVKEFGKFLKESADDLRDLRLDVVDENESEYFFDKSSKIGGNVLLWLMEYFIRVVNKGLVDNFALRGLEKGVSKIPVVKTTSSSGPVRNGASFVSKLSHDNPWVASYLVYYGILAMTLFGTGSSRNNSNVSEDTSEKPKEEVVSPVITIGGVYISPEEKEFVKKAIGAYFEETAFLLTEFETYRATPKTHVGERRATSGLGGTYTYYEDSNGVIHRKDNPQDASKMRGRSKDENYEQVRMHLEYETVPKLLNTRGKNNINRNVHIALLVAGYQRPADVVLIANQLDVAKNIQQIGDAFYAGCDKINKKWRVGTIKRRWWCAAYACGYVTKYDFVNATRDAFSKIDVNTVYRNGHFVLDAATVEYAKSKMNGKNKSSTVSEFLSDFSGGKQILKNISEVSTFEVRDISQPRQIVEPTQSKTMTLVLRADTAYRNKNYENAVQLYLQAIDQDVDNMEAYSSLALTYKRLGDEKQSLEYYDKCTATIKKSMARMNANRELLYDADVKAASYYNAGSAREGAAKIYEQRGDITQVYENYDKALKNYKTALENNSLGSEDSDKANVINNAIKRMQAKVDSLKAVRQSKKATEKSKTTKTVNKKVKDKHTRVFTQGKKNVKKNAFIKSLTQFTRNKDMVG